MGKGQDLYKKAKTIIPGGTQLLTKRPEMFLPDYWPSYYKKAKGCQVWDLNDNQYLDFGYMGIGACILGYADSTVDDAVINVIQDGSMTTLNPPEEVYLAELLCKIHPWAKMVRYTRSGGEAMTVAVRIARAYSKKDIILFCGYHGWHDWYLAANLNHDKALDGHLLKGLRPEGVPRGLLKTALPLSYNNCQEFKNLINENKGKIGAIVIESIRNIYPDTEFIQLINNVKNENNIPLVVDEISAGFRLNLGGAHLNLGIDADIAVFAKGMSNGYPMAAIIGKPQIMTKSQDSFISSTYWTEKIGPVAAMATINKMKEINAQKYIVTLGEYIQNEWKRIADQHGIKIIVSGIYPLSHFTFDYQEPLVLKTLFTQLMLEKGFLATNALYTSCAHTNKDVSIYLNAFEDTFCQINKIIKKGNPKESLKGSVCHSGFKRLT